MKILELVYYIFQLIFYVLLVGISVEVLTHRNDYGQIFPQCGSEQAWLIRDLLHNRKCLKKIATHASDKKIANERVRLTSDVQQNRS